MADTQAFLNLLASKYDEYLKKIELQFVLTKSIDRCIIDYLFLLGAMTDTDLSPYGIDERLRMHLKAQTWLAGSRGTIRCIKQIIKLYLDWFVKIADYQAGAGYGIEEYGLYPYGSVGTDVTYKLKLVILYEPGKGWDDPLRDEKVNMLVRILPKYMPAWASFEIYLEDNVGVEHKVYPI